MSVVIAIISLNSIMWSAVEHIMSSCPFLTCSCFVNGQEVPAMFLVGWVILDKGPEMNFDLDSPWTRLRRLYSPDSSNKTFYLDSQYYTVWCIRKDSKLLIICLVSSCLAHLLTPAYTLFSWVHLEKAYWLNRKPKTPMDG